MENFFWGMFYGTLGVAVLIMAAHWVIELLPEPPDKPPDKRFDFEARPPRKLYWK